VQAVVKIDAAQVVLGLQQFRLQIAQREELMRTLGAGQLLSIYKTFDEGGSPSGSWPPLSPVSLRWNRKYTAAGHKLLMNTQAMRHSIDAKATADTVTLSPHVAYAPVQQFGFSGDQSVRPYSYNRRVRSRDMFGKLKVANKLGRQQTVRRKLVSGVTRVNVHAFTRHIRIPARPFVVFRPEDRQRIETEVKTFIVERARAAGLEAN